MSWFWIALAVLAALAAFRYVIRIRSVRSNQPTVDDDAIRQILETGSLPADVEDEPLDLDEAARAEEEFWNESWDEPEEYGR